eukprot:6392659-Amphidinium_carterae.1
MEETTKNNKDREAGAWEQEAPKISACSPALAAPGTEVGSPAPVAVAAAWVAGEACCIHGWSPARQRRCKNFNRFTTSAKSQP